MKLAIAILIFLAVSIHDVTSARILAVFPITAKSHHILFSAVLRTLAGAGHEVVFYSGIPADKEVANLTTIHLANMEPIDISITRETLDEMLNMSPIGSTAIIWKKMGMMVKSLITDKHFIDLIRSNEKFDLVLLEALFAQESLFALAHKFQAPVVNFQPFGAFSLPNHAHGNSLNLAYIPDFAFPYSDRMSFYQRATNAYSILSTLYRFYTYHIPEQDRVMRKMLDDPTLPPLEELMQRRLALTFTNGHPYVHYAQPYTPNIHPIGGIHLAQKRKPLPADMKKFLDESPEGVIYFSVGSILPDQFLDDAYFNSFTAAFRQLPQRVLWKTKRDLKDHPNNIMTSKWVPQQDVLAHPNVKVFMTHGGLFSQHEAIHAGVPVVCTPYFGDQPMNAKFYEEKGIGVVLPFHTLSEKTILSALSTVLRDSKYRDNMARMSRIFRDRPISPADTLVFWVEYVIRHGGAPHLKPAAATMPFYQLFLLDVVGILLVALLTISIIMYLVIKRILSVILSKHKVKTDKDKKEK